MIFATLSLDPRTIAIAIVAVLAVSFLGSLAVGAFLASLGNRDRYTVTGQPRDLDGRVVPMRRAFSRRRQHRRGDAAIVLLLVLAAASCSSPTAPMPEDGYIGTPTRDGVVGNGGGYQSGYGVGWP